MIEPKELRVGNLVKSRFGITEVYSVSPHKVLIYSADKKTIHNGTKHGIEPITITPELLIELGFYSAVGSKWSNYKIICSEGIIDIVFTENDFTVFHVINGTRTIIEHIHYIHRLQNLNYALTENELIWNTMK